MNEQDETVSGGTGKREESAIRRLQKELYARVKPRAKERSGFYRREEESEVPEDWSRAPEVGDTFRFSGGKNGGFFSRFFTMKKLFIVSLVFFILAVVFFLFVILRGGNIISARNVSILVEGPTSTPAGEEIPFKIVIKNNNNTTLEFSDLIIEYPPGTRVAKNLEEELTRFRRSLGTIPAGKTVTEEVSAVLFGQEGDEKEMTITLEYRAKNSNAIFVAERKHVIHISSSPFVLSVAAPEQVSARQEFAFEIELSSRAQETVEDILIHVNYPFGFSFTGASPKPSFGNDIWDLGDVPTDGKRTITVRGALEGQEGDEKVFRIEGGLADSADRQELGVIYGTFLKTVRIVRPSLGISLSIGGSHEDTVAVPAGARVNATAVLTNNSPTRIEDVRAEIALLGDILDKSSVRSSRGFYRSVDDTIIWDKSTMPDLSELAPGDRETLSFSFVPSSPLAGGARIKNPVISVTSSAQGKHLTGEGVLRSVETEDAREVRVNSDIDISSRAIYSEGPFVNSGPLPPKAEQETTYTIVWTIVNTANNVRNVRVEAVLPAYVRWTGNVSPSGEKVLYDPGERRVSWDAGDVLAWKGVASSPREVAFQVALLPSVSQVGKSPVLAGQAALSGTDEFTEAALTSSDAAVTTELATDPAFQGGDGIVVQ